MRDQGQKDKTMEARRRSWFVGREKRWGRGAGLADRAVQQQGWPQD